MVASGINGLSTLVKGLAACPCEGYDCEMTVTVTLDLPPDAEGESSAELARRLRLLWALDEVRQGRMTRLRAANLVELSLDDFLRQASNHGLDAIDYDVEDFRRELEGAP
jgi:hypothetical protein